MAAKKRSFSRSPEARKAFVEAAEEPRPKQRSKGPKKAQGNTAVGPKWAHYDATAAPSKNMTLRLNEWQLARLTAVAAARYRSKQSVVQEALDRFIREALGEEDDTLR